MKAKLLRDSKREGKAGEIVEVSPERLAFLYSIEAAIPVKEAREQAEVPEQQEPKKTAKKTTAKRK